MPKKFRIRKTGTGELLPPGLSGHPEAGKTAKQLGCSRPPPGSKYSSLESVEDWKDLKEKEKFYVSAERSVYQQRVIKVNEKNYLIRTIPGWRRVREPSPTLICKPGASPSNTIHQSHFLCLPRGASPLLPLRRKPVGGSRRWPVGTGRCQVCLEVEKGAGDCTPNLLLAFREPGTEDD